MSTKSEIRILSEVRDLGQESESPPAVPLPNFHIMKHCQIWHEGTWGQGIGREKICAPGIDQSQRTRLSPQLYKPCISVLSLSVQIVLDHATPTLVFSFPSLFKTWVSRKSHSHPSHSPVLGVWAVPFHLRLQDGLPGCESLAVHLHLSVQTHWPARNLRPRGHCCSAPRPST